MRCRGSRHIGVSRSRHALMHVHGTLRRHRPRKLHICMRTLRLPITKRMVLSEWSLTWSTSYSTNVNKFGAALASVWSNLVVYCPAIHQACRTYVS